MEKSIKEKFALTRIDKKKKIGFMVIENIENYKIP